MLCLDNTREEERGALPLFKPPDKLLLPDKGEEPLLLCDFCFNPEEDAEAERKLSVWYSIMEDEEPSAVRQAEIISHEEWKAPIPPNVRDMSPEEYRKRLKAWKEVIEVKEKDRKDTKKAAAMHLEWLAAISNPKSF